jgi:hypothetical protein
MTWEAKTSEDLTLVKTSEDLTQRTVCFRPVCDVRCRAEPPELQLMKRRLAEEISAVCIFLYQIPKQLFRPTVDAWILDL